MIRKSTNIEKYSIIRSQLCDVVVVWRGLQKNVKIITILLPEPKAYIRRYVKQLYPYAALSSSPSIDRMCEKIRIFSSGRRVYFDTNHLDLSCLSVFQRRVLLICLQVPFGRVTTYGRMAEKVGKSRAARAVGSALARNPFPLVIPCHRIIRSDGLLGGFGGGLKLKRKLLELEGVKFERKGRVLMVNLW